MSQWQLAYEGFDPGQERLREALCTLGNGYFATRGAGEESEADASHYPGTYLAGCYNRLSTDVAGRTVVNEDLVNLPNWLCLNFRPEDGKWLNLLAVEILSYRQELDLRNGVLTRRIRLQDPEGRITSIQSQRIVHMQKRHLAGIEMTLTAENWSGRIVVRSALNGAVINAGVARYRQLSSKHLKALEKGRFRDDAIYLLVETNQSHIQIATAARTQVFDRHDLLEAETHTVEEPEFIGQDLAITLTQEEPVTVEKIIALYCSKDRAISESSQAARRAVTECERYHPLLESHTRTWRFLWRRCDVELRERPTEQMILRLHIFHLLQTVSMNTVDLDVGVPARGLHGEAYRGHIFWDELFILLSYTLRFPEIARALLLYRYHRLDAARRAARECDYQGAMYPWQSASEGIEETQRLHLNPNSGRWLPDHTDLQRHVNIAIVYNIWQYFKTTGDLEFMVFYGAEMVLEIARFWASIATFNTTTKRYDIAGVMGPDEYHDQYPGTETGGLRNNAYTNVMAVWVLERALEVSSLLTGDQWAELTANIGFKPREVERWRDIAHRMTVPFHGNGIISQFQGYEQLQEFDWDLHTKKYGNIERLDRILEAEGDSTNRYKVSKQADVLMLFYLLPPREVQAIFHQLGYELDDAAIRRNFDYYTARTSHGSTLSRVVHAFVSARFDRHASWNYFTEALRSDIADTQGGTTPEGIHLGAMGGIDDLVLSCYAGIHTSGEHLSLDPCIPDNLPGMHLRIRYRRRWVELDLTGKKLHVSLDRDADAPFIVDIRGVEHTIPAGAARQFSLS